MRKILVTTDGSENSIAALLEAKLMAKCTDATIDILHVSKNLVERPYMRVNDESLKSMEDLKDLGKKILNDAEKLFDDFSGEVNLKLMVGSPADVIIELAQDEGYDLIVMGSRGLGTFSRTILGSVSNKVLNHSKTNVLIVK
nr:universal stress protein [Tissierella sp.]